MEDHLQLTESDIAEYARLEKKTYAYNSLVGMKKERYAKNRTLITFQNRVMLAGVACVIFAWFYIRLGMMEKVFEQQYLLYYGDESNFNDSPDAAGSTNFTLREVAIAAEFPQFYDKVLVTTMSSKALKPVGAIFLLTMLARFPSDITKETWAGSQTQLGLSQLHTNPGGFLESFQSWSVPSNKFRWLCKTQSDFDTNLAIQCRVRASRDESGNVIDAMLSANADLEKKGVGGGFDILQSLFEGGLCRVALVHVTAETTPADLTQSIAGKMSLEYANCDAQKIMQAAATASNVAGAGMTGLGVVFAQAGGSLVGGPIAIAASLGIAAATVTTAYFMAKNTSDTTICTPPTGALMVNEEEYTYSDLTCGRSSKN